jgi:small subunit ribosomal protein S2
VKYLEDLEKKQASGDFEKYTKREKAMKEKEIATLRKNFDGIRKLTRVPDAVFVSSLKESQLPVREAKLSGVKIIAIVNTDSDPKQVDYPIPANDNSKKAVEMILETIKKALLES